jgi:ATP-dependent DNA helicase RecG
VLRDEALIDKARTVSNQLLKNDPSLNNLPALKQEVEKLREDESARFMDKS